MGLHRQWAGTLLEDGGRAAYPAAGLRCCGQRLPGAAHDQGSAGVAVTVEDDNGGVTASGFTTPLKIKSDNGDITVRDSSGDLALRTDNGTVSTQGVSGKRIKAESDNGAVRIALKAGAVPEWLETVCDNGDIDIRLQRAGAPYAVEAKSDNGSTRVDVPTDAESARVVNARSDNGSVKIRLAG